MKIRKIIREVFLKKRNPIRYILERRIFPFIKNKDILYVGVAEYTKDYPKRLRNNNLITLDYNYKVKDYGAKEHFIEDITNKNITKIINNRFDIIFLIGIFGYGVDTELGMEKTLRNCYNLLKDNGIIIIEMSNKIRLRKLKTYNLFCEVEVFDMASTFLIEDRVFYFWMKKPFLNNEKEILK